MLLLCGDLTVPQNWHVAENEPPYFSRIYYICDGEVLYCADDARVALKAGYLYCFPTARPYRMTQNPARPLNCLFLHLDATPGIIPQMLEIPVPDGSFLQALLLCARRRMAAHGALSTDAVLEKLGDTLLAYLRGENLIQSAPYTIHPALSYISAHLEEALPLEYLSDLCGYHPQYFIRLFRKSMGVTPHQYIISYRMRRALHHLQCGCTVSQTAARVGYTELRNFSRAFHTIYGIAPAQWRKVMQNMP